MYICVLVVMVKVIPHPIAMPQEELKHEILLQQKAKPERQSVCVE